MKVEELIALLENAPESKKEDIERRLKFFGQRDVESFAAVLFANDINMLIRKSESDND